MRLAVLGRTHWLTDAARRLRERGHAIVLVATAASAPEYLAKEPEFEWLAHECAAPFLLGPDVNSDAFRAAAVAARAEIAVSVNWPTLVGEATCAAFPFGVLNAHPGDLPRYRGNACPNWAILAGESHVGLCIHAMDPNEFDAGPIYARHFIPLDSATYIADVYREIDSAVPYLFCEAVDRVGNPAFTPEDQRRSSDIPMRCHPRRPEDGLIDWREDADQIARLVRASSRPFGGAFSFIEGATRATIWRAASTVLAFEVRAVPGQIIGRSAAHRVLVACGRGVLEIEEAECADGRPLPGQNRYRLTIPVLPA